MSEENLMAKLPKPELPENWNYEESVQKVQSIVYKWKTLTNELAQELWIAREKLSKSGAAGHKNNLSGTKVPLEKTWSEYCQEIGSSKQVVNRWLSNWFEKEVKEKSTTTEEIGKSSIETKFGDKIKLGKHILYCNDAHKMNIEADAVITDPPYGINYEPNWKKWDGSKSTFEKIIGDAKPFNPQPFMSYKTMLFFGANYYNNKLPVGGWLVWDKRLDEEKDRMVGSPFELAWFISQHTEKKAIIKRILHGGVVNADSEKGNNEPRFVPTQKPVLLMELILEELTLENETIYDPFVGSGSTLLACETSNRKCIAVEIKPENCSITISRWEKLTGKKAELLK